MTDLIPIVMAAFLGLGTGIFTALSLIEKAVWPLMWAPGSSRVSNETARKAHAILKHVIHLFPPTMMITMLTVSVLMICLVVLEWSSPAPLLLAALFFIQLITIVARLRSDIRGVDTVSSDGDIVEVRSGLGTLALLHHRGLLMTTSTLIALAAFILFYS